MPNKVNKGAFCEYFDTFIFFLESELSPKSDCIISFGDFSNGKFIFFNAEQLSRPVALNKVMNITQNTNIVEIWDYSKANIDILKNNNIQAKYVQVETPQWYIDKLYNFRKEYMDNFEYDVGFAGFMSNRRRDILDNLTKLGIKVNYIEVFGDDRDKELAKCKLLINIHTFEDYKIFEVARCEPWLKLGVPVISENSLDNDPRCINVDYDKLVETVVNILNQ